MFVGEDSFLLLSAFLNGYVWGLKTKNYFEESIAFGDFTLWLRKRFNVHDALAWSHVIILQYPIDREAREQFPILFREFLISQLVEKQQSESTQSFEINSKN
jgi:hypothetical protein